MRRSPRTRGSGRSPRWLPSLLAALVVIGAWSTAVPAVATSAVTAPDEPSSLASIGDSITRATNAFGWYGDHPDLSWSTGFDPLDGFDTHYERLLLERAPVWGDERNVAAAGARMADAPSQAFEVVRSGAEYVTILMGANDVCAASVDRMTSVASFTTQFERTMHTLAAGAPRSHVFVASIPDLEHLASVYAGDPVATRVWALADICPSVLSPSVTWLDRLQVTLREHAFNLVLDGVCARYANCRFDDYAVFSYRFTRDEVSRLDYFHPSLDGQRALAELTWSRSWWAS